MNKTIAPALWMLLAALCFAVMGVCVKFGASFFTSMELVFYRGMVGVVCMFVWAKWVGVSLVTRLPWMHAWRTTVGVTSLASWFYALGELPIATAMTLNYMSGIWLTAFICFGALVWGRKIQSQHHGLQGSLIATVLVGFVGVLLVLRPAFDQGQIVAGLVGLLSGFLAAFAYMQVTALARRGEPEVRTVFYFACGTVTFGGVCMMFGSVSPWPTYASGGALWLLPIGLLASIGQVCMTRAYSSGQTLLVANLQYMGIVFSAIFGLFLLSENIPWAGWLGITLIIASGIAATTLRAKAQMPSKTPEPAEEY